MNLALVGPHTVAAVGAAAAGRAAGSGRVGVCLRARLYARHGGEHRRDALPTETQGDSYAYCV